jgi:hypothetical protein
MFIFTPNKASRTDAGELRKMERDWSVNWGEVHGYRDRMQFPEIPRNMDSSLIAESVSNLCSNFFDGIEKCIDHGRASEHPKRPFERLVGCKTQWFQFERCIRQRDRRIMGEITKWESDYAKMMKLAAVDDYLSSNIDKRVRFYQYMSDQSSTQQKAVFYERHKNFMLDRGIAVRRAVGIPLSGEELDREKQVRGLEGKETDMTIIIKNITSRLQQPEKHRADAPPS